MLNKVRVKINGKINLSLNITGKKDGYHLIDSVVASVSVSDYITVRDRLDDKINLIFNADFLPQNNTVLKAVNLLRKRFGDFGVDIVVDKFLPLGGGMGGSSADAAGVIAALNALFDFDKRGLDLKEVCSEVGADVFYMLNGGFARLKGIGDDVTVIDGDLKSGVVYIYGGETLSKHVYSAFDKIKSEGEVDNDLLIKMLHGVKKSEDKINFINKNLPLGNMLFSAACLVNDKIKRNFDAMKSFDLNPNMTGSGSIVYAFTDDCVRCAALLKEKGFCADYAFITPIGIKFV